jgi:hypothetical protein
MNFTCTCIPCGARGFNPTQMLIALLTLSTAMSFRRPQVLKPNKSCSPSKNLSPSKQQSSTDASTNLVDIASLPPLRRPFNSRDLVIEQEKLLYAPGGPYTQPIDPAAPRPSTSRVDSTYHGLADTIYVTNPILSQDQSIEKDRSRRQQKEAYRKWTEDVIPSLLVPYLTLLQQTNGLQQRHNPEPAGVTPSCRHKHPSRKIDITCVYLDSEIVAVFLCH